VSDDEDKSEGELTSLWQGFINNEAGLPKNYRRGIYTGMVEQVKQEHPATRIIPTWLIERVMEVESSFRPLARSAASAIGLMQVRPETFEWMQKKHGLDYRDNIYDPKTNIRAGMLYLRYLRGKYKTMDEVLQAYNVGPGDFDRGVSASNYLEKIYKGVR
jgi:soluble lytic murein transglycosylase-like protein